jgi:hypothetical protein
MFPEPIELEVPPEIAPEPSPEEVWATAAALVASAAIKNDILFIIKAFQ